MQGTSPEAVFAAAFEGAVGPCLADEAREDVPDVPGAFVIRNVLSEQEIRELCRAVRLAHCQREVSITCEESERRDSQHHAPVRVSQVAMEPLCQRLRPFLPSTAGPSSQAMLETPGREISTFLRCYRYKEGDCSKPHFDKPWHENNANGSLSVFSAYSLLFYLSDSFEGGQTTFFKPVDAKLLSCSGLTLKSDDATLAVAARVAPKMGDVLVFPHGRANGCHPNPLHEGSTVVGGEKLLIRTDALFRAATMPQKKVKQKQSKRPKEVEYVAPVYYWDHDHSSYTGGQLGDGTERRCAEFARAETIPSNPDDFLQAVDRSYASDAGTMMHLGPARGGYLDAVLVACMPMSVLEVGTYIGYSAIRIGRLLSEPAHLWTIEPNPENAELAEANLAHCGLSGQVTVVRGTLSDDVVRRRLPKPLDLVFLDHRKSIYLRDIADLEERGYIANGTIVVADDIGVMGKRQHANHKAEEYAQYVRSSGRYVSCHRQGDGSGIELSEAVAVGDCCRVEPRVITDDWCTKVIPVESVVVEESEALNGSGVAADIRRLREEAAIARAEKKKCKVKVVETA